ncbi:MAG: helix-turn-helix domain-containing protein [Methylomonas sp.]|nr:helix-turn-helix domain-containing protein [Methylomonas sp.]
MTQQQKKPGRPPITFSHYYIELAHNYCLLGATDEQLAQFFNVPESTILKWQKDYPDFSDAIKRGRILADMSVAESLYRTCLGYTHTETTTREIRSASGEILSVETVTVTREMPPDTAACIFWLKSRQPDKWRDKTDVEYILKPQPEATDDTLKNSAANSKG